METRVFLFALRFVNGAKIIPPDGGAGGPLNNFLSPTGGRKVVGRATRLPVGRNDPTPVAIPVEEFTTRMKGIVQQIDDTLNVDGLWRSFKQRVQQMVERNGDRIRQ